MANTVPNLNISRTLNMLANRKPWEHVSALMSNDLRAVEESIQKLQTKVFSDPPAAITPTITAPIDPPTPHTTVNGIAGNVNIVGSGVAAQPGSKNIIIKPNAGKVNLQTTNYTPASGDSGKHIPYNSSTPGTYTLPNPAPPDGWWIATQCVGTGTLTIDPNGLTLDTSTSPISRTQGTGSLIFSDGFNYWTCRA
jgi:hypothetical protein